MYLFINNLSYNKIFLAVFKNKSLKDLVWLNLLKKSNKSENILIGINKLFLKANINIKNINGIIVVNGPGSFTSIRIGLSVANTIAWLLDIPVTGVKLTQGKDNQELINKGIKLLLKTKKSQIIKPFYGKEPNITVKKHNK